MKPHPMGLTQRNLYMLLDSGMLSVLDSVPAGQSYDAKVTLKWSHNIWFNLLTVCDVIFYVVRKTNAVTFYTWDSSKPASRD
jgi:hypothetical protein